KFEFGYNRIVANLWSDEITIKMIDLVCVKITIDRSMMMTQWLIVESSQVYYS
ncbi:hypothetical protein RDWZM_006831, partial [Blomia tropicalis]